MNNILFVRVSNNRFILNENSGEMIIPDKIIATYKSNDGFTKEQEFKGPNALKDLRNFIEEWVGLNGDISDNFNYIASDDGVGIVAVKGVDLHTVLGRPSKPKLLSNGYVKTLAEIAMKLNFPQIMNDKRIKIESTYHNTGLSFVLDWNKKIKDENEQGRFVTNISQDEYTGEINCSVSIFRYMPPFGKQTRDFDDRISFKSNENREYDLKQIETVLKRAELIVKKLNII